jgi:rRNA maturation protein Rpf1
MARRMAAESGERYVARGKKTVDSLAGAARALGDSRITIIEDESGSPARLAVIEVDELGRWRWAGERLLNSTEKK